MDSKLTLVDSSVLVSFFVEEDSNHESALKYLDPLEEFAITDYILLEVTTVLKNKVGLDAAKKAVEFLTENKNIHFLSLTNEELGGTLKCFFEQKHSISFVDASLLVMVKQRGMQIATLDQNMVKAGKDLAES